MSHEHHDAYIGPCDGCTGAWCNFCKEHVIEGEIL